MTDLVVVTPSRGRPQNVARLVEAMGKTRRAATQLVIGLDSDDPTILDYPSGPRYLIQDGMQRHVVQWINYLAMAAQGASAIGHFGDDCLPLTDGWDVAVLEALEKTPFAFGNDLSIERPPGSLCTHLFMRGETHRQLGYFGPPSIQHMWVDLAWMCWGEIAGMTYLHDVIIEHLHFLEGKAGYDMSYQLSRKLVDRDLAALWAYVRDDLNADIQKLKPGAPPVTGANFLRSTVDRGAPVPVPDEFVLLAGRS